jgi:protein TonB
VARETPPKSAPKPRKATAKAPSPNLDALIGGIAMNVPEFAAVNVKGDANELLDDLVEELVMSEQTVDSKPKVTSRPPMSYPVSAVRDGLKGFVVVNLLIARDGSVELAKIVESQPRGVFDNTVLSGVHDWVFIPARYKGQPVKVWARQRVSFSG